MGGKEEEGAFRTFFITKKIEEKHWIISCPLDDIEIKQKESLHSIIAKNIWDEHVKRWICGDFTE